MIFLKENKKIGKFCYGRSVVFLVFPFYGYWNDVVIEFHYCYVNRVHNVSGYINDDRGAHGDLEGPCAYNPSFFKFGERHKNQ